MSFKSKDLYFKIHGDYALWTSPESKGGGEKFTYSVPTRQGLTGIVDSIYYKPTFKNIVDEVKVINLIQTDTKGIRAMVGKGKADLNYVTYLADVCYYVKYHFEWNENRTDLEYDRNQRKHEAIAERAIKKGGRRDTFLGTRECLAFVEAVTEEEYTQVESCHAGQTLNFGIMFHSFEYPDTPGNPLFAYYTNTIMADGIIKFKRQNDCGIKNELSNYEFKYPKQIKSVEEEYKEMEE
ncbi:type I-C CRISPR-associated protein Cas5c [Corticicoccus populi]|uniref:pre-crRNA processing endonuclease n=1 Tax=Corticicoccus populi TaxID=1812821 RepID=A0ABW5WU99_9STAP